MLNWKRSITAGLLSAALLVSALPAMGLQVAAATTTVTPQIAAVPGTTVNGTAVLRIADPTGATAVQWNLEGSPIPTATGFTYQAKQSGIYTVSVNGSTSAGLTLTVGATEQAVPTLSPAPAVIPHGGSLKLTVGNSTAFTAPVYHWYKDGGYFKSTAATASLDVTAAGNYTVQVVSGTNSTLSAPLAVTAAPPPQSQPESSKPESSQPGPSQPPAKPANPTISGVTTTETSATVSWGSVTGATKYNVYRSTSEGSGYTPVAKDVSGTTYTDKDVKAGTRYFYQVTAVGEGGEGPSSAATGADIPKPKITLTAPGNLKFSNVGETSITLTWDQVDGAAKYHVYFGESASLGDTAAATVTSASHTQSGLKAGTTYYFAVAAATDTETGPRATGKQATVPALKAPTGLKATANGTNEIKLTWSDDSGADSYTIYRSTDNGGSFVSYKNGIKDKSYTDTGLSPGTTYSYKVTGVRSGSTETGYSNTDSATTAQETVDAPQNLRRKSSTDTGIVLEWNAVAGADSYDVYRTAKGESPVRIANTKNTTHEDKGLTPGTEYTYVVRALKGGNESGDSDPLKFTTKAATITAEVKSSTADSISLSWNRVDGADKYRVSRSAKSGGTYEEITTTKSTSTTDNSDLLPNTKYFYKVAALDKNGKVIVESTAVSGSTKSKALDTPKNLKVTVSGSSVSLSWSKIDAAGSYEIHRATSKNGTYARVDTVSTQSFTDKNLAGGTYYYKVRAMKGSDASDFSAVVEAKVDALPAPKDLKATPQGDNKIQLSWSRVSGATRYNVYRATSQNGTYSKVGDTASLNYTDGGLSRNTVYYYKVEAERSGDKGAQSGWVSARTGALAAPAGLKATAQSDNKIQVSWNKVTNATSYNVYRSTAKDGTYSRVNSTTSLSFTDTKLDKNTTYYYKVLAVRDKVEGQESAVVSAKTGTLAAPTGLKLTTQQSGTRVQLSWSRVSGADSYNVYRATSRNGSYSKVGNTTSLSYTDTDLNKNRDYFYKVAAVSSNDEGNHSSTVSTAGDYALDTPENFKVSRTNESSVTLSWSRVSGAKNYQVYRSTAKDGSYTRIGTVTAVGFTDSGLSTGRTYYYQVAAYNGDEYSDRAGPVSATTERGSTGSGSYPKNTRFRVTGGSASYSGSGALTYKVESPANPDNFENAIYRVAGSSSYYNIPDHAITLTEGSCVVSLSQSWLQSLPSNTYALEFQFEGGNYATTALTVGGSSGSGSGGSGAGGTGSGSGTTGTGSGSGSGSGSGGWYDGGSSINANANPGTGR